MTLFALNWPIMQSIPIMIPYINSIKGTLWFWIAFIFPNIKHIFLIMNTKLGDMQPFVTHLYSMLSLIGFIMWPMRAMLLSIEFILKKNKCYAKYIQFLPLMIKLMVAYIATAYCCSTCFLSRDFQPHN